MIRRVFNFFKRPKPKIGISNRIVTKVKAEVKLKFWQITIFLDEENFQYAFPETYFTEDEIRSLIDDLLNKNFTDANNMIYNLQKAKLHVS